ncbi:unnamed protein product, partial [Ilex paraguariensis]
VLVGMVLGKVKVPWKYKQFIDDICGILHRFNIKVSHIFREANGLADFLASYAVNEACCFEFLGTDSLPIAGKMRLHHDQLSLSTLRRQMILVDSTCRQLDTVDVRLNGRQEQLPLLVGLVLGSFCFGLVHVAGGLLRPAGFGLFTCTVHVHSLFNAAAGPHSSVIFYLQLGFDGLLPGFSAGLRQLSFLMVSAGSWSAAWPSLQAATVAGDCSRDCSRDLPGSCCSCFSAVIMLPSQLVSASHGFASVSWLWISFSCCSPRFQLTQLCFGSFGCFHTVAHGVQLDSQLDFQRLLCSYLAGSAAAGLLTFSLLGLYGLSLLVSAGFNGSPAGISAVSHPFYGLCAFACPDAAWIKANFGLSLFVQAILLLLYNRLDVCDDAQLSVAFYAFFSPFLGKNVYEYVAVGVYSFLALCVFVLYVRCRAIDPADPGILTEAAETPAYGLQNDTDLRGIASSREEPSKAGLENGGKSDRCGSSGCSKIVGLVCGFFAWEDCRKDEDLFAQQTGEEDALFCTLCNAEDDLTATLVQQCHQSQFTVQRIIETAGDNEALLFEALAKKRP